MSEPEYIPDAIPGFEVWRDTEAGLWRARHEASGRTTHAKDWELLVWRACEVRVFVSIARLNEILFGGATP